MDYLYLASRSQGRVYVYTIPDFLVRNSGTRLGGRGRTTMDIARDSGSRIWVAVGDGDYSVECYAPSGRMVAGVERSLVPHAAGVTIDGNGILWVSDDVESMIYGIDVSGPGDGSAGTGSDKR